MDNAAALAAIRTLPLRQDVRWIDLPFLFPGRVIEATRNPALGLFGAIDLQDAELAARVVELHNASLPASQATKGGADA